MASTYSDLKVELIGTGEQSGTWGTTTNTNLSVALGEAITGSANVTFASANATITLTDTNGAQTARNLRLNLTGTSSGTHYLILGSGCNIEKLYLINNTLGNAVIVQNTAGGTGVTVPANDTMFVYNTGTNVVDAVSHLTSLSLTNDLAVADGGTGSSTLTAENVILGNGTSAVKFVAPGTSGNILTSDGTTWTSSAPPASGVTTFSAGTTGLTPNSASNGAITLGGTLAIANGGTGATTNTDARTNLGLGTIATQNSNNVSITGGTVSGITDLAVADGGTGSSTLTAENVILGNGTSAVKFVAPGTSGNILTSNGTTWTSAAATAGGFTTLSTIVTNGGSVSIPAGKTSCVIRVIGGGGNGGQGSGSSIQASTGGGGGGSGGASISYFTGFTNTSGVTVSCSAMSSAGTTTASFLGITLSSTAGAAGTAGSLGNAGGNGGAGGTASASGTITSGSRTTLLLSGSGGGAGILGTSGSAAGGNGGASIISGAGNGGIRANGTAGAANSGGGGGGGGGSQGNQNGGAGAAGIIIVEY